MAMKVGDRVKLVRGGVSVFVILEIDGDHAIVESLVDAPGKYPFQRPLASLVRALEVVSP